MNYLRLLACFLLLCSLRLTTAQEEGDIITRTELAHDIPADSNHPVPRKLIQLQEEGITCQPSPKKILAVHYRARPTAEYSLNDDRIVIAVAHGDRQRILKVYESDAGMVNNHLDSQTEFDQNFIDIGGMRFLYIRERFAGSGGGVLDDVYSISSDDQLFSIPFQEVGKPKLLKPGEELRNGVSRFENDEFTLKAGIYQPKDPECCPSRGTYHARFTLTGEFKQAGAGVFKPEFKFMIAKEWRSPE